MHALAAEANGTQGALARPLAFALRLRPARLGAWLAIASGAVVLSDIAVWLISGEADLLVWLLYGGAVTMLSVALVGVAAPRRRCRNLRFQPASSSPGAIHSSWLFRERLREEIERGKASGLPVSVVVLRLGRGAVLGADSEALVRKRVRSLARRRRSRPDVAGQLGPGEFALYLPATDRQGAVHASGGFLEELHDVATGALGVAAFPGDGGSPEQLVEAARRQATSHGDDWEAWGI
jgi:GGDEF domain-containing protein